MICGLPVDGDWQRSGRRCCRGGCGAGRARSSRIHQPGRTGCVATRAAIGLVWIEHSGGVADCEPEGSRLPPQAWHSKRVTRSKSPPPGKKSNARSRRRRQHVHVSSSGHRLSVASAFEILHRAFVLLGGRARCESAKVAAAPGSWVLLSRVKAVFARFEFADHRFSCPHRRVRGPSAPKISGRPAAGGRSRRGSPSVCRPRRPP
jgi:hypothetical protein